MVVRVSVSAAPQPGASAIADAQRRRAYQGRAWRAGTRLACWSGAILLTLSGAASQAQVLDPLKPPRNPPWNAHEVFEPLVFPDWWDRDERDKREPEDRPVKVRQHPGYESVGLRAGSWMVYPSMTLGGLFDSNVFASNIDKRSDIAAVVAPTRASTHAVGTPRDRPASQRKIVLLSGKSWTRSEQRQFDRSQPHRHRSRSRAAVAI